MLLSFNLLTFLFWMLLSTFVPGAILSFSLFKKDDFLFIEKLFIGFALGFILLPLIPFLLYFIAGVHFSFEIALFSVGLLYAVALASFAITALREGGLSISLPNMEELIKSKKLLIALALLAVILASYMVRIGSYGPIFQELDPYYYTYTAQQLLVLGENPFDDQTSWFPELEVSHRIIPEISYLEAIWYSLYNGSTSYDNMLLSVIAGMYPPLAAALAIFFIYLLVSAATKREWGLAAAGIAAFVPVFVYKLAAGEMEVQPYAFFSLMFLYAMYALSMKKKDLRFSALAGLGFAAVALGSSSQLLALASLMLFMGLQAVAYFLRDDKEGLRFLLVSNSIVFALGPLLGSAILKDIFGNGTPSMMIAVPFLLAILGVGALLAIKQRLPGKEQAAMVLGAIALVALLLFAFSPVGDFVKNIGKSGFGLSEFNQPLDRTIAEQGVAPTVFGSQIGFIADTYIEDSRDAVVSTLLWPVALFLNALSTGLGDDVVHLIGDIISLIMLIFSVTVNVVFAIGVQLLNVLLGTSVDYSDKANSFMLFWMFAFWAALAYSLLKFTKKEDDHLFLLFFALIMPPFLVGIIKAKYTIYSGVLLATSIGFTLGVVATAIKDRLKDPERLLRYLLAIGAILVLLQFVYNGFSAFLLWGSVQPLYQNDPAALAPKFQGICDATGDASVCAAAADPIGYASKGTNYQYSQTLCMLSVFSDLSGYQNMNLAPEWERQTAFFRCQRISDYWIDSMQWLKNSTEPGSRVISWWDYGHWINFFGDRNSVLRNEHQSHEMIGAVADKYLDATPEELKKYMQDHDTEYALFDVELIAGGGQLGGKYGALNYLSCAWNNETNVSFSPGQSECEAEHLWEVIFISQTPCTISSLTNKTGLTAYKIHEGGAYRTYYRSECIAPTDPNLIAYCQNVVEARPTYCVGNATLMNGMDTVGTYYLNETYPNGDLKLNKATMQFPYQLPTTMHMGPVTSVTLLYTDDPVWLENGAITSGFEDRKGKFYDSNLYRAIFVGSIPGFELAYSTADGAVKIYSIAE